MDVIVWTLKCLYGCVPDEPAESEAISPPKPSLHPPGDIQDIKSNHEQSDGAIHLHKC